MIWGVVGVAVVARVAHDDYSDSAYRRAKREEREARERAEREARERAEREAREARERELGRLKNDLERCYMEEINSLRNDNELGQFVTITYGIESIRTSLEDTRDKIKKSLEEEIAEDKKKIQEIDNAIQRINKMTLNSLDDTEEK